MTPTHADTEPRTADAWKSHVAVLSDAGVASPEHDARVLVRHAQELEIAVAPLVARRAAREPLQLILGTVHFREIELAVRRGVLIPRPETEIVAGVALDLLGRQGTDGRHVVADVCTGAGPIALSIAAEAANVTVIASDIDATACDLTEHNVERLVDRAAFADGSRVSVVQSDLLAAVGSADRLLDGVVANPPYLPVQTLVDVENEVAAYEPALALTSGDDGLDVTRRLIPQAAERLRDGGFLVLELDPRNIHDAADLVVAAGFTDVAVGCDLTGRERVLSAIRARD